MPMKVTYIHFKMILIFNQGEHNHNHKDDPEIEPNPLTFHQIN